MKTYIITAAIIMKKEQILLVNHGPEYGEDSYWCLPGGVANEAETAFEGMLREVKEETGIVPSRPVEIAFFTEHINNKRNWKSMVPTYIYEVDDDVEINIQDPDGETLQAKFFSLDEVVEKMKANPFLIMREPLLDYLKTKQGKIWTYRETANEVELLYVHNFR